MREALGMNVPELYPWSLERWNIVLGTAVLVLAFGFALATGRIPDFLRPAKRRPRFARRTK